VVKAAHAAAGIGKSAISTSPGCNDKPTCPKTCPKTGRHRRQIIDDPAGVPLPITGGCY